jgi:oligosaccharide repeat unit polymerase
VVLTRIWGLATLLTSVLVAWLMIRSVGSDGGLWLPTVVITAVLVVSVAASLANERDLLSPMVVLSGVFFLLYVVRPAYVVASGRYGPTRAIDDRSVDASVLASATHALWLVALGVTCVGAGYALHVLVNARGNAAQHEDRSGRSDAVTDVLLTHQERVLVATFAAVALSGYAYWRLVQGAGGFSQYLSALSLRGAFFFGHAYVVAVALPLKIIVLILATAFFREPVVHRWRLLTGVALVAIVALGDFLTGGRAGLLLGTLLPLVILFHYLRRPVSARALAVIALLALLIFVSARVVTRDAIYAGGNQSRTSILISSLKHLPTTTVGGREVIEFDSLLVLVRAEETGHPALLWGRTYLPIISFPVPRRLWPAKPAGGGNTWFTQTYFPGYYAAGRTETSISFFGESYANFGVAGIAVLSFALGFGLSAVYRRFRRRGISSVGVLYYAIVLGYAITLIRGDAFHSVTWCLMSLALTAVLLRFLVVRVVETAVATPVLREGLVNV